MNDRRKHWSELGRVKNSSWFRNLPEMERACVLEALEHDTHESAVKLRATLAVIYLTALYTIALAIWGVVFRSNALWFGIGGAALGLIVGLVAGNVISRQKTPQDAKSMQTITGLILGGFGALLIALGLVGWIVRSFLFS